MVPLFSECIRIQNVVLPNEWIETMVELDVLNDLEAEQPPIIPEVISCSIDFLQSLTFW